MRLITLALLVLACFATHPVVAAVAVAATAAVPLPITRDHADALIAAVAESAEMTVVTRNTRHFEPLGVPCLNPWDGTASGD